MANETSSFTIGVQKNGPGTHEYAKNEEFYSLLDTPEYRKDITDALNMKQVTEAYFKHAEAIYQSYPDKHYEYKPYCGHKFESEELFKGKLEGFRRLYESYNLDEDVQTVLETPDGHEITDIVNWIPSYDEEMELLHLKRPNGEVILGTRSIGRGHAIIEDKDKANRFLIRILDFVNRDLTTLE